MVFAKVIKNKAYFKRFQVKYRRRREGKTDYRARLRLTAQDKNKFSTPKYRLVVRFTRKDIICQIVYATIAGDVTICSAYAHELPRYGLKTGLTSYAAAYCVGLLIARRVLAKFGLDELYEGCTEPDGEDFMVEEEDEKKPFRCNLDVGLARTSTGARVFGALKGALDGGLYVPHDIKRFPGYTAEDKQYDAEVHLKYIMGGHISEYMELLEEEEPEKYQEVMKGYIEEGIEAGDLEELLPEVHEKIREDPSFEKKERKEPAEKKKWRMVRLTYEERKANLAARLAALREAEGEDED